MVITWRRTSKSVENDTEEEIELKKKILEIYNKRLDERNKRKDFVVERGLLDIRK
jgi:transcriptional adapter 2-alpha